MAEFSGSAIPALAITAEIREELALCEDALGVRFRDPALLRRALMHASGADHRLGSNERLEFLGDSILNFVVCERLFREYPQLREGDLTKIKSAVVSRSACAQIADGLGIAPFLVVGKGMRSVASLPPSLLADVFESLIAAIYLDQGLEAATTFLHPLLTPVIEEATDVEGGGNYKSLLQQKSQRDFAAMPRYVVVEETGPDHAKRFLIAVEIDDRSFPPAWGRNKKEAEQLAAKEALEVLGTD
jgi:ribonuclease-3